MCFWGTHWSFTLFTTFVWQGDIWVHKYIYFSLQLHCEPILKLALYRQASSGVRGPWEIQVVAKNRTENLVLQVVGKDKGKGSCNSGRFYLVTGLLIRHLGLGVCGDAFG